MKFTHLFGIPTVLGSWHWLSAMDGNPGAGGGGGGVPPRFGRWGHNIKCPPPSHDLWVPKEAPFSLCFDLLACLLYGRGWWCTRIPLPRVWKIDPTIFKKEKCVGVPPPPPPPPISFSGLARLSRLAADRFKKNYVSPMVWFGLTPAFMMIHYHAQSIFKNKVITILLGVSGQWTLICFQIRRAAWMKLSNISRLLDW